MQAMCKTLMLAATYPIFWLTYGDITPVCQLTAQGRESRVGKNNFCSPQLFNSLSVKRTEQVKAITKALGGFIAKYMQPYAMVEDEGFQHTIKVLEPRYNIPFMKKHNK